MPSSHFTSVAMGISFDNGGGGSNYRSYGRHVRLVRSDQ